MNPPTRPPNRSDGPTAVTATEEKGGDPARVDATGASAQTSRSNRSSRDTGSSGGGGGGGGGGEGGGGVGGGRGGGEGGPLSPARCRSRSSVDSLDVFQKRSIFTFTRRHSSGYFSLDSESQPSSPLSPVSPVSPVSPLSPGGQGTDTVDRSTQTPSPSGQAMNHVLQRMAEAPELGPLCGSYRCPSSMLLPRDAAQEMQVEAVGQELRRIGDDYNRLLLLRGAAGGRRHVVLHPNQLPHVQQEPTLLLCMGLLLLVIGRLIYMHGGSNLQDHSQV